MSADATLALLQKYYDLFNSGDRPALLDMLTDDVVHDINQGASEVGREAFTLFLERMDRCYREQVVELVVYSNPDGLRGSAEFYIEGTYLQTDEGLPPPPARLTASVSELFLTFKPVKLSELPTTTI